MTENQPITRPYRLLADNLATLIKKGSYAIGERLPAERTLAEDLKVSRPVVREAIIALEMMGLVEVRPGSGIYVVAQNEEVSETSKPQQVSTKKLTNDSNISLFELLEARKIIEADIAALAATSISKAQLKQLQKANKALEAALDDDEKFDQADQDFHNIIAQASQNSILEKTVSQLWQHRLESDIWRKLEDKAGSKKLRKAALKDHQAITKALESGKASKAYKAMNKHLDKMIEIILRDYSSETKKDDAMKKRLVKTVA